MDIKDYDLSEENLEKLIKDEKIDGIIEGISPIRKKMERREECSKLLQLISEKHPEALYDKWDTFLGFLKSDNAFSKFPVVYILANLLRIDKDGKFEDSFEDYFNLLNDKSVAISSHVAVNVPKIIAARPELEPMVTGRLIDIDSTEHTEEHKALIKSYIIQAFSEYFEHSSMKDDIFIFVMNQLDSSSPKTRKMAKQFIKEHGLTSKQR